jgi:hypothetical protein
VAAEDINGRVEAAAGLAELEHPEQVLVQEEPEPQD